MKKILVVEDDENSRFLQQFMLESAGYSVYIAENGKEGLLLAETHLPDLIISDILMPVMDGYSLCREIRNHENLNHIPFLVYSATYTSDRDKQLALDLGATEFIVKPMDPSEFLEHVKSILAESTPPDQKSIKKSPLELEADYSTVLSRKLEKKVADLEENRKKLEASEQKYRRLVEALHDNYFFYTYDASGNLTYISPSCSHVLGYSEDEAKTTGIMTHLTDHPMNTEAMEKYKLGISGVRQPQYEVEILHKNGKPRFLELTEYPILAKTGEVDQIEGIAHDITERKCIEAEKEKLKESLRRTEKNQALGSLASGIAHDFNNILMFISGYAEMLQMDLPKDSISFSYVEDILNACKRASDLIKQILSFSRRSKEEKKVSYLQPIIKETLQLMKSSIPSSIKIQTEIDSQCPPVMADPTQIYEILLNLCTNAYHAMRDKGGVLKITLYSNTIEDDQKIKPGRYCCLEIMDTGCGIETSLLDQIFEPFFTTKSKGEGTGIGLAVVSGIVQNHNGYIHVNSKVGKGTIFQVYLPAAESSMDRNV